MSWRLLHRLFGYDYIQWKNSADQGIARVRVDGMGRAYYWRYTSISVIDFITDPKAVVWLTCSPEKYMDHSPMRRIAKEVAAEQRTLEAERDAAEETVRLRAEATRLLLERWRKEADIDEVRMKLAAIEAMGYEWRWTKSIDENGEQVGAWVERHDAAEADASNAAWRKSDGE